MVDDDDVLMSNGFGEMEIEEEEEKKGGKKGKKPERKGKSLPVPAEGLWRGFHRTVYSRGVGNVNMNLPLCGITYHHRAVYEGVKIASYNNNGQLK